MRQVVALLVVLASFAIFGKACGAPREDGREIGGPLYDPASGTMEKPTVESSLHPPRRLKVRRGYAGITVIRNTANEPAVIEAMMLLGKSPGLKVVGFFTADDRRFSSASDAYEWPPDPEEIPPGSLRPAVGSVLPAAKSGHGVAKSGLQVLVAIDFPKRGREGYDGIEMDYRVGDKRYRVDLPDPYVFCGHPPKHCPLPSEWDR